MKCLIPLALLVEAGGLVGFFPYRWNWKKNRMVYRSNAIWRATHAFWSSIVWVYATYLMWRTYSVYTDPMATNLEKVKIMYMSTLHLGLNAGFLLNLQGWGEHHLVFNQLQAYAVKFKNQYGAEINLNLLKWLLRITFFAWVFACSNAVAVFRTPDSKRLLSSLLADPKKTKKSILFVFFCIHWTINTCQFYFLVFNSMMLMCYNFFMIPIIGKLNWHSEMPTKNHFGKKQRLQRLLPPTRIHGHSIRLAILQAEYTSAYGAWLFLIFNWGIIIIALNIFQVVVFQKLRPLIAFVTLSILLASVSKNAGRVFELSTAVKHSWRGINNIDWFSRYCRAYRPARVPLGSFFYFDRGVWPTFFNIIMTTAANLIVSYREE